MDQQPVIEIAEFPHDNKLWRIDGLGKIFSQLKITITCLLKSIYAQLTFTIILYITLLDLIVLVGKFQNIIN